MHLSTGQAKRVIPCMPGSLPLGVFVGFGKSGFLLRQGGQGILRLPKPIPEAGRLIDQHTSRDLLTSASTHLVPLVEHRLERHVRLQLGRIRLVDLPPQLTVALQAGNETGLGETVAHDSGPSIRRRPVRLCQGTLRQPSVKNADARRLA